MTSKNKSGGMPFRQTLDLDRSDSGWVFSATCRARACPATGHPKGCPYALADQRVECSRAGETAEVPVRCPQLPHSMQAAEGCDPGVMYGGTRDTAGLECGGQFRPITGRLSLQHQARSLHPSLDLSLGNLQRAGGIVYARVRYDGQELMQARPRNGPRGAAIGEFGKASAGCLMPGRVLAMSVNQDVGIHRDHAPRPS